MTPLPPGPRTRMPLDKKVYHIIIIQNLYVSGIVVGGGGALIFYINVNIDLLLVSHTGSESLASIPANRKKCFIDVLITLAKTS